MQPTLRSYHWILSFFVIPTCIFLIVFWGWSAFSTITERPGLNGSMYLYYGISKISFTIYTTSVSLASMCIFFFTCYYLIKKRARSLSITLSLAFVLFIAVILFEYFLFVSFSGKA